MVVTSGSGRTAPGQKLDVAGGNIVIDSGNAYMVQRGGVDYQMLDMTNDLITLRNVFNNQIDFRTQNVLKMRLTNDPAPHLELRGGSPTIKFLDSNALSAHVHVNDNRFYVLRGCGIGDPGCVR
jgi:hypothetical protein